ncbi:prisilkin-39-like isoform X3 [Argopecten irradians]|uniref:prisilkin-39-like isoform X3 n=1 Tax=Argopecten irradians TaxID=31199 RepID=UPI003714CDB5
MKVAALLLICVSSALATYNVGGGVSYSAPIYQGAIGGSTSYQTVAPTFIKGRTFYAGASPAYSYGGYLAPNYEPSHLKGGFMANVATAGRASSGLNYGLTNPTYSSALPISYGTTFSSPAVPSYTSYASAALPNYGVTGIASSIGTGMNYGFSSPTTTGMNYGFSSPTTFSSAPVTSGFSSAPVTSGGYTSVGMPTFSGAVSMPGYNAVGAVSGYPSVSMPGYPIGGAMPAVGGMATGYNYGLPSYNAAIGGGYQGGAGVVAGPLEVVGTTGGAGSFAGGIGSPAYGYNAGFQAGGATGFNMGFGYDPMMQMGFGYDPTQAGTGGLLNGAANMGFGYDPMQVRVF